MVESRGVQQFNNIRDLVPLGAVACLPVMAKSICLLSKHQVPVHQCSDREEGDRLLLRNSLLVIKERDLSECPALPITFHWEELECVFYSKPITQKENEITSVFPVKLIAYLSFSHKCPPKKL